MTKTKTVFDVFMSQFEKDHDPQWEDLGILSDWCKEHEHRLDLLPAFDFLLHNDLWPWFQAILFSIPWRVFDGVWEYTGVSDHYIDTVYNKWTPPTEEDLERYVAHVPEYGQFPTWLFTTEKGSYYLDIHYRYSSWLSAVEGLGYLLEWDSRHAE